MHARVSNYFGTPDMLVCKTPVYESCPFTQGIGIYGWVEIMLGIKLDI